MMERRGYEQYGLTSNPFQELASENLEHATLSHVDQEIDLTINTIAQEVLDGQRKAIVVLVGPLGVGKTQRLKVVAAEAERVGAFAVFEQLTVRSKWIVLSVAQEIKKHAALSAWQAHIAQPKWLRRLQAMEKKLKKEFDPEHVGETLAAVLNENAPSYLLLNDVHNIEGKREMERFIQTLHVMANHIKPGVLIMMTCYSEFYDKLRRELPQFTTRVDRVFDLGGMSDEEAALLVAKRLPSKRLVEDLDPLYPFDETAVGAMNEIVQGNPRKLLKLADKALETAVRERAFHIDAELVRRVDHSDAIGSTADEPAWTGIDLDRPLPPDRMPDDDEEDAPGAARQPVRQESLAESVLSVVRSATGTGKGRRNGRGGHEYAGEPIVVAAQASTAKQEEAARDPDAAMTGPLHTVPGLDPDMVAAAVDGLGGEAAFYDALDQGDTEALAKVPGVGKDHAATLIEAYRKTSADVTRPR